MNVAKVHNKLNQIERLIAEVKAEIGPVPPKAEPKESKTEPTKQAAKQIKPEMPHLAVAESVPTQNLGPRPQFNVAEWPKAVLDSLIVKDEATKDLRAAQIATSLADYYRNKRVLDFGCGDGRTTVAFAKEAAHVVGYDPNEKALSLAQQGSNYKWRWSKDQFLAARDTFDFIVLYDVLDHLVGDDPHSAMLWVRELLAPGGSVYLRCHPWTSRHGSHLYEAGVNKAFLHLTMTPAEMVDAGLPRLPNVRIARPLATYQAVFKAAGFEIREKRVQPEPIETFFGGELLKRIIDVTWGGKASKEEALKIMTNSFIDYDLVAA
jgi:2-polyprenyl-3-methyl-5-hydroxy-6-metoxy-1,4-benzoquinol methylase